MSTFQPNPLARLRTLLERDAALTLIPAGVVEFRESYRFYRTAFVEGKVTRDEDEPQRLFDLRIALAHETVHFVQSITARYVFEYAEQVRALCCDVISRIRDGAQPADIEPMRQHFADIERGLDEEQGVSAPDGIGVSPRHLMEAAAVIESLRSLSPNLDITDVFRRLPRDEGRTTYGRVLGLVVRRLGPAPAIELVAPLSYLALSSSRPGETFVSMLDALADQPASFLARLRPSTLFDVLGFDSETGPLGAAAQGQAVSRWPVWSAYVRGFAQSGSLALVHRVAASPLSLLAQTNWSEQMDRDALIDNGVPPLALFEDGYGSLMGRTRTWDREFVEGFLTVASIMGAGLQILSRGDAFQPCAHVACPVHATRLCHFHYPPDPNGDWRECSFTPKLQAISGRPLNELCRVAGIKDGGA